MRAPTRPRVSGAWLSRLVDGWDDSSGRLHDELAAAIRSLIVSGTIDSGVGLPSERELSLALAVSRTTVATAYDTLRGEGLLRSRHGSGTWVDRDSDVSAGHDRTDRMNSYVNAYSGEIDLSSSALPGLPMVEEATEHAMRHLPGIVATSGFEPYGLESLRAGVAGYFERLSVGTDPDQVLATNGSQHALHLIAETFVEPGDVILVEETTYRGAIEIFRIRGAHVVAVPCDHNGMELDALERAIRTYGPRLVYVLPVVHNPTGRGWSLERRRGLGELVERHGVRVVDDGSTMDLLWRSRRPRPLARDLPADHVISVGSTTKLFWGGLRVGWVRAPGDVIEPLARLRCAIDLGGSLLGQLVAAELLPRADEARAVRREQLAAGASYAREVLEECLPRWTCEEQAGGSALWVQVDGDAVELVGRARRNGVRVNAGAIYSPEEECRDRIRLPIVVEPDLLAEGLSRLAPPAP